MRDFKYCYPDANTFYDVIKLKPFDEWKVEYTELPHGMGYWIAENPFLDNGFNLYRDLIGSFPIQKDNNREGNFDPNPFDTIHLPEWVSDPLTLLVKEFYLKKVTTEIYDPQLHEWGNIYFKERAKPISCWRIPHMDYVHGIVANLWFTDHELKDSSTKLYYYHGKVCNDIYDFQIDTDHPLHKEWRSMSENPQRVNAWYNPDEEELLRWGFEFVGDVPTREGTMSMYKANYCHNPFISENINFRWSHAFALSHEKPPVMTLGGIFK